MNGGMGQVRVLVWASVRLINFPLTFFQRAKGYTP